MRKYHYDGKTFSSSQMDTYLEPLKQGSLRKDSRFKKSFELVEGPNILDVGCSIGAVSYTIAKEHPNWEVTGVDILPESIRIAKEKMKLSNSRYEVRDVLTKPFKPNSFDCVIFLETIEHVDVPGAFIRQFHRVLKPGGFLIVSTPNALAVQSVARHFGQNIRNRLHAIRTEPKNTGTHLEHVGLYDVYTLVRLLDRNGLQYQEHHYARFNVPLSRKASINLGLMENVLKPMCDTIIVKARKPWK